MSTALPPREARYLASPALAERPTRVKEEMHSLELHQGLQWVWTTVATVGRTHKTKFC